MNEALILVWWPHAWVFRRLLSLSQPETSAFFLPRDCSKVAAAFAYVMTDMWLGDADCVSPEIFLSALGNLYPAFMKKTQQDAQEFLIYVLNELHESLKKVRRMNGLEIGETFCFIGNFYFSFLHLFGRYCLLSAKHRCWGDSRVSVWIGLPLPNPAGHQNHRGRF